MNVGWNIVRFGDVVKNANLVERDPVKAGIERIVGLEHIDPENLHIRRWDTPEDGSSFSRKFVPGQTLFGKRRAYQRKVAFAEFEGICSGDILTFESKNPKLLLPELMPFICQTDAFFNYALGTSAGSLSPRTSWSALQDFEFPLPSLAEQKRIAEILWAADEALERFVNSLNSFYVMKTSFSKRYFNSKTGYPEYKLSDLLEVSTNSINESKIHLIDKAVLYSIPAYDNHKTPEHTCGSEIGSSKYVVPKKCILLSKLNPRIPRVWDVEHSYDNAICSTEFWPLIPKGDRLNLQYLKHALLSDYFLSHPLIQPSSSTNSHQRINRNSFLQFPLPIPGKDIQDYVVIKLERINQEIKKIIYHIESLKILLKNIRENMLGA